MSHKNVSHKNVSHQNVSHQNVSHQNVSHQNVSHQNVSHQNVSHQNVSHQNVSHHFLAEFLNHIFYPIVKSYHWLTPAHKNEKMVLIQKLLLIIFQQNFFKCDS